MARQTVLWKPSGVQQIVTVHSMQKTYKTTLTRYPQRWRLAACKRERGSGRGNTACGGWAVGGVTQHVGEGQWEGQHSMRGRGSGRGNTA